MFLEHFGVDNNTKSEEWKKKWYGDSEWVKNRTERIYNSMKKNGSFKESKPEKAILDFLRKEYVDVLYQHKDSKRYPFRCDYYIPKYDIFIEYNGFWTHGGHPFDKNSIEDLVKSEQWKNSERKSYNAAYKTWVIKDTLKRETAQKNNLKYIELWYNDAFDFNGIKEKISKIAYNN